MLSRYTVAASTLALLFAGCSGNAGQSSVPSVTPPLTQTVTTQSVASAPVPTPTSTPQTYYYVVRSPFTAGSDTYAIGDRVKSIDYQYVDNSEQNAPDEQFVVRVGCTPAMCPSSVSPAPTPTATPQPTFAPIPVNGSEIVSGLTGPNAVQAILSLGLDPEGNQTGIGGISIAYGSDPSGNQYVNLDAINVDKTGRPTMYMQHQENGNPSYRIELAYSSKGVQSGCVALDGTKIGTTDSNKKFTPVGSPDPLIGCPSSLPGGGIFFIKNNSFSTYVVSVENNESEYWKQLSAQFPGNASYSFLSGLSGMVGGELHKLWG